MPVILGPRVPLPTPPVPRSQQNQYYPGLFWQETFESDALAAIFDFALGSTASIDSTHAHSGSQSLHISQTGTAASSHRTMANGQAVITGRFWFWIGAIPSATITIVTVANEGLQAAVFNIAVTTGFIAAGESGATHPNAVSVCDGTWHSVDFRQDYRDALQGQKAVLDWKLDGVAQTQSAAAASGGSAPIPRFSVGTAGAVTIDYWIDDVQLSDSYDAYPLADIPASGASTPMAVTDTGVTQTDAVASTRQPVVFDTGVAQSDSIGRQAVRGVADTGESQSDSLVGAPNRVRGVTDFGVGGGATTPGTPYLVATPVANGTTVSSVSITTNAPVATGDTLFIAVANRVATTGAAVVTSVSGITADEIKTYPHSTLSNGVSLVRAFLGGAGLASGTTITLNFSVGGVQRTVVAAFAVPGVAAANVDQEQGADEAAGSTFTVTAAGATSGAPAIEIGVAVKNATATTSNGTPGTGWTELVDQEVGATTFTVGYVEYRIITANETPTAVFNWSDATGAGAALVAAWDGTAASGQSDTVSATKTTGTTRNVSDTGESQTDSVATLRLRNITDTGVAQSDTFATTRGRAVTDTGLAETDSVATARLRAVTDTGVTQTDAVATTRVRVITTTGVTQTDAVAAAHAYPRGISDTGMVETDTVATTRVRGVADTGVTGTDAVAATHGYTRSVTDTGLTETDSVATTRVRVISDTGESQTDAVATKRLRAVADTGVIETDTVAAAHGPNIAVSTTGVTQTDSVATQRAFQRPIADTGTSQTDSTSTLRVRFISTTGLSQSDSVAATRGLLRTVTDTGETQSDSTSTLRVRFVVTTGVTQTDLVTVAVRRVVGVADSGLAETDAVLVHVGAVVHPARAYVGYLNTTAVSGLVSGTGLTGIPAT